MVSCVTCQQWDDKFSLKFVTCVFNFGEISDNISETVQNTTEDNQPEIMPTAYRMARLSMTFSKFIGHFSCLKFL